MSGIKHTQTKKRRLREKKERPQICVLCFRGILEVGEKRKELVGGAKQHRLGVAMLAAVALLTPLWVLQQTVVKAEWS